MSICPHVSAWLLLEKFLWNLVLVTVTKICWEIQIWLKSEKNIENFTLRSNMFHVVGSDIVAQQYIECIFVSMATLSIHITSLTATYVHPQYNRNTLLHFHDNDGYANMPQCYVTQTLPIMFSVSFSLGLHTEQTDCVYFLPSALLLLKLTFCLGLINMQILSVIQKTIPLIGCSEGRRLSRLWKKSLSPVVKLRPGVIGPGSITDVRWLIFFAGWGFLNNCLGICPKLLMKPMVAFFFRGSSMLIKEQI